jgi:hypothetical protein
MPTFAVCVAHPFRHNLLGIVNLLAQFQQSWHEGQDSGCVAKTVEGGQEAQAPSACSA